MSTNHTPGRPDPAALPLFAPPPVQRPGRVRGAFTMTPAPAGLHEPVVPPRVLPRPYAGDLDWGLVAAFRQQASDRLSAALGEDRGHLTVAAQRERGRAIIVDLLEGEAAERIDAGTPTWSPAEQAAMATAIDNALFGLGRLQPLVDDDSVENIIITGHDQVTLELVDGRLVPGPAVADTDQELIDFLVFLASRSEVNARPFSQAQPRLHLRLDGGARLAAAAWVTPRPCVVIRRHRLRRVTLDDLVARGAMSPLAASFLAAAVRARRSIVVAGAQGAGKTTLVRALCAQIPKHEAIGTFETEYELHLHELTDQHPIVFAWEARPGSGERGPDGTQAGEFTLSQALFDSLPVQPVPADRRGGPRPRDPRDAQGDGVRGRVHLHHPRPVGGGRDRQARHLRDGGRPARHPRLRGARHRGRDRRRGPRPPRDHPHRRRDPATAPVGRRDHHRHRRGEGEGVRDPARVPHPPGRPRSHPACAR